MRLRGFVRVDMMTAGPAVTALKLQGGDGVYRGRLQARDRARVGREYHALFDRFDDPRSQEFAVAKAALSGVEIYRLQLWPEVGGPPA